MTHLNLINCLSKSAGIVAVFVFVFDDDNTCALDHEYNHFFFTHFVVLNVH